MGTSSSLPCGCPRRHPFWGSLSGRPCAWGSPSSQMPTGGARMLRGRAPAMARLAVMGTISVIVPSLNDADYLAVCLDALAKQTRRADEVIVVDNGSTDATAEVARAAGARVVDQPVRGIWPATAAGFDAASGDVLARLDADSVPAPDWLAEVERRMSRSRPPDGRHRHGALLRRHRTAALDRPPSSTSAATSPSSARCSDIRRSTGRTTPCGRTPGSGSATSCTATAPTCTTTSTSPGGCSRA